jgi:RND family efflux transporter MFP subunit
MAFQYSRRCAIKAELLKANIRQRKQERATAARLRTTRARQGCVWPCQTTMIPVEEIRHGHDGEPIMLISNRAKGPAGGRGPGGLATALLSFSHMLFTAVEPSRRGISSNGRLSAIDKTTGRTLPKLSLIHSICYGVILAVLILGHGTPRVSAQDLPSTFCITEPIYDVTVGAPVAGTISTIYLREGDRVERDQRILEQEKQSDALEVKRRKLIAESKVEVIAAKERAAVMKMVFDSALELYNSTQSVSREELKKSELDYLLAQAEYMKLEVGEEREQIEYEMAAENLNKRTLKSPLRGIITKLYLEEGESCDQHQPLVDIADTSKCRMVCNVEENIGRTLRKGATIEVAVNVGSDTVKKEGRIVYVSPVIDSASNLMEVKVELDNDNAAIRPGVSGSMLLKNWN